MFMSGLVVSSPPDVGGPVCSVIGALNIFSTVSKGCVGRALPVQPERRLSITVNTVKSIVIRFIRLFLSLLDSNTRPYNCTFTPKPHKARLWGIWKDSLASFSYP